MGLESFSHLVDNIPEWMQRLDSLSKQVSERHAEFAALAKSADFSPSLRKNKTGSMESLKPRDEISNIPEPPSTPQATSNIATVSTPPLRVDINPESKRLFQDYRLQAKRKRTSASILSNASGPQRFRSRMSLIVYYDSAIQDGFSWLVRSISSARNNLRKGKTNASLKARLAGMGMEESPFGDRQPSMRNPKVPRLPKTTNLFQKGGYSAEAFDQVDKELEAAQSLCEIGAHQFLRDGVCADELSGTRERFDTCLGIAKEQKEIYLAMEEQREQVDSEDRESFQSDPIAIDTDIAVDPAVAIDTPSSSGDTQVDSIAIAVDNGKTDDIKVDSVVISTVPDIIEVDDNDDSASFHVDLSAFRKTRRGRP